ncbi:MAG: prepilin-type N-terminal cleavage/methylation domain-containing protein [Thermovirgaceae bacterium]|nr:prepilin-type N-terminal cleavage/methylation domain-containing protein [Thermovirgaceae bacterium]
MSKTRRAFTLTEVLIAIAIGAIVLLAAVSFLFSFILNLEQTDEHSAATQRAEMVLTILSYPVLQSGIGMPSETDEFQESLNGLTTISGWNGPVEVSTTTNANDTLHIVYGMGTGRGLSDFDADSISDGETVILALSEQPQANTFTPNVSSNPKGWCLLPASGVPLRVTAILGSDLSVAVASASTISADFSQFDQLYMLRGMEAWVTTGANPSFYTNDLMGGGPQPRVQGISGLRFDFDPVTGILSAVILARGNKRHDNPVSTTPPDGWDTSWGFSTEDTHYRLSVLQTAWRVRN